MTAATVGRIEKPPILRALNKRRTSCLVGAPAPKAKPLRLLAFLDPAGHEHKCPRLF
jgi:hypothetical protein